MSVETVIIFLFLVPKDIKVPSNKHWMWVIFSQIHQFPKESGFMLILGSPIDCNQTPCKIINSISEVEFHVKVTSRKG